MRGSMALVLVSAAGVSLHKGQGLAPLYLHMEGTETCVIWEYVKCNIKIMLQNSSDNS